MANHPSPARYRLLTIICVAVLVLTLQSSRGGSAAPLNDPWTLWEFFRNYTGGDKIDRLHNSFAIGARGGCSGTMLSPHVYLTAAHCGSPIIDVYFYHIDEDAPVSLGAGFPPPTQFQQISSKYRGRPLPWQNFIYPNGAQEGDTQLFWLDDGADGVAPGIKYGYIELSPPASVMGEQLYSFWFNPENGLNETLLYSDGEIDRIGTQPIGDPPLYFAHSNLFTRPGASGSSVLRASDNRVMGVTAIGGGNSRVNADMAHLLAGFDGESDQVLDIIEYDFMLTGAPRDFQRLRFDTALQRSLWKPMNDQSGGIGFGPNQNAGLVGGNTGGPSAYRAHWNGWLPQDRSRWPSSARLEDFEDGQLNVGGVTASAGSVLGPGANTDSVDNDDGDLNDFSGTRGRSFYSPNGAAGITFNFGSSTTSAPTRVGIAWTDGEGLTTFEAFDLSGNLIARIGPLALADGAFNGGTREDRFFQIAHQGRIGSIKVSNSRGGIEVDHLQFDTSPLFSGTQVDALSHTTARFAPNTTYRISAVVFGLAAAQGQLKLQSRKGNTEEVFAFTPVLAGWQRITGRITTQNQDDYRLLVSGGRLGSFYLSEVSFTREDTATISRASFNFDTAEDRRAWEYVGGSHPTSWGLGGAADFAAVVDGPSAINPDSADYGFGIRNRHIGLQANKEYEISFEAQHTAGPRTEDVFVTIEDLNGVVDEVFNWRFTAANERVTKTFRLVSHTIGNGITFGAYGSTNYLVDNIRIREVGPAPPCTPTIQASGDRAGQSGTTHTNATDGNTATFFNSSSLDRQRIQLDLSCPAQIQSIRRYMTRDGVSTVGSRSQDEGFSYSLDGVRWIKVTSATSSGWQSFATSRADTWRGVSYGWSPSLVLSRPVTARYVRFNWDDDGDAVNEIEIRFLPPGFTASVVRLNF